MNLELPLFRVFWHTTKSLMSLSLRTSTTNNMLNFSGPSYQTDADVELNQLNMSVYTQVLRECRC